MNNILPFITNDEINQVKQYITDKKLIFVNVQEDDFCIFSFTLLTVKYKIYLYDNKYILQREDLDKSKFTYSSIYTPDEFDFLEYNDIDSIMKDIESIHIGIPKNYFNIIRRDRNIYDYYQKSEKTDFCPFVDIDEDLLKDLDGNFSYNTCISFNKEIKCISYISEKGKYHISPIPANEGSNILDYVRFDILQLSYNCKYGFTNYEVRLMLNDDVSFPQIQYIHTCFGKEGLLNFIPNLTSLPSIEEK